MMGSLICIKSEFHIQKLLNLHNMERELELQAPTAKKSTNFLMTYALFTNFLG